MATAKKTKRVNKTKEEVIGSLVEKQREERINKFKELYDEFRVMAGKETGMAIAANLGFDPARGVFPTLVIVELPKNETQAK